MSNFDTKEYHTEGNESIQQEDHILMHLDIDYFFAQVEILKQPKLRDKPVIVGHTRARETGRGVVLTCNYPAREFGVHSGQPMKTALEKCPDAVLVKSSYDDYKRYSNIITEILQDLAVPMRKAGIDEAYVDLTPLVDGYDDAKDLVISLKEEIFEKTKLTVSIGVGPTLKIAKICSDYNKPDGITIYPPENLDELFNNLPLIDVPGIGKKTAARLEKKGFTTCDQLRNLNKAELVDIFGKYGLYYYDIFYARSTNKIKSRGPRKSISHSRTFKSKPGEIDRSVAMMNKLFELSYTILEKEKFLTKTVGVTVRFNGFETITRAKSLPYHSQKRDQLFKAVEELIIPHLSDSRGIRLLGVGFHNLQKIEEDQTDLGEYFDSQLSSIEDSISLLSELPKSIRKSQDRDKNKKKYKKTDLEDFF